VGRVGKAAGGDAKGSVGSGTKAGDLSLGVGASPTGCCGGIVGRGAVRGGCV
jgi:hypothetical protein